MSKARITWLDVAKGIAIFAVIIGHTFTFGNPIHAFVYSFHIPIFFILAGFTFRVKPTKEVLVSSVKRLLVPYLAVCSVLLIADCFNPEASVHSILLRCIGFVFASGGASENIGIPSIGIAWFLMALFVARLAYNSITMFMDRYHMSEFLRMVIFFAIALLSYWGGSFVVIPLALFQGLVAMFFLHIGRTAKKFKVFELGSLIGIKALVTVAFIAVWATLLHFGVFFSIGNMFYPKGFVLGVLLVISSSWVIIWICILVDEHIKMIAKALSFAGINSLLILCFHQIDMLCIDWGTLGFATTGALTPLVICVLRIYFDMSLVWIASLNPVKSSPIRIGREIE